jgi:tetratricopeptide (TPR) repeat protein
LTHLEISPSNALSFNEIIEKRLIFPYPELVFFKNDNHKVKTINMDNQLKSNKPAEIISPLNNWLSEGIVHQKARQYKEALKCFEKAAETEPANAQAWYGKAESQVMCLKYPEAVESCAKAIELNPANAPTWFLKSFAHGAIGQYQEALDSCTKGFELDPSNKMVWCIRGQYLYSLGRLEEALESFGTALKMNPESEYFKTVTAKVTKWLQREGKSADWTKIVMSFLQQGGYKEALDTYQESLKVDPRSVTKAFEKDFALAHLENPEKILKDFEKSKIQDQPQIILELSQKEFEFYRESWVEVSLSNKGKTPARNLSFSFSSELTMKLLDISPEALNQIKQNNTLDVDTIPELAPGNQTKKLVALMPTKPGPFPLEAQIRYTDIWGNKQCKTNVIWISSLKPSEQLPPIPGHKMLWRINSSESANVYVAQRRGDSIYVVIKITNFGPEQSSLSAEFLNETKQCSRLIHPNIIKMYQYGDQPAPWVSMEYMSKGTLTRRLGKININESMQIAIKITDALAFARTMRITHRNVHPDNILFDANDVPKLTNWRTSSITQKLHKNSALSDIVNVYYPPEKLSPGLGGIDWLSDVYQLGVLLYEMLSGNPPYSGKGEELISNINKGKPLPPSVHNSKIIKELDLLVLCCLSGNKKERYQSIASLKTELERIAKIQATALK